MALLLLLLPLAGCATARLEEKRFEFVKPEMGVPFRIVLYAANEKLANRASAAAFQRIEALNAIMSDYEPDSELTKLSATSGLHQKVPVSPDLWTVLERSQKLAEQSGGMFDVTVGPCITLWRRARREHKLPDPAKLAEALKSVGYQKLILDPKTRTVELTVPRMKLDLGAIAKGYAADQALLTLRAQGIRSALVGGAGDFAVSAPPPGKPGWRIEIAPLDDEPPTESRSVTVSNSAVSTSGDSFQKLEINGKRYSHIVNPHTGIGLTDHSLVNVLAPDCMTSDSLATAVSVLGPNQGLRLLRRYPGAAARIVRRLEANRLEKTFSPRFEQRLEVAPR